MKRLLFLALLSCLFFTVWAVEDNNPCKHPKLGKCDIELEAADRPSADSSISATCAPVYDSLCARGVSVQQSNEELRKRASPYKSPSFRP